jgi:hypothetical protein
MKPPFKVLTALVLSPLTALHSADAPSLQPPQHLVAGPTPAEDLNNYVVLSTSSDNGATWNELLTVDPDAGGTVRSVDPELSVSPDGRLFFFRA